MDKNKKLATDLVLDALKRSGIKVVRVSEEKAMQFLKTDEYASRAQFSFGLANDLFRSNASIALDSISQNKATAAQWLAMLTNAGGIKAEEDKWTGLTEWLESKGNYSLTRSEVRDYVTSHAVRLKEEVFIDAESINGVTRFQQEMDAYMSQAREEGIFQEPQDIQEYAFEKLYEEYGDDFDMAFGQDHGVLYVVDSEYACRLLGKKPIPEVRLEHTTEDLDNRTEIALYCPDIEPWNEDDDVHFGQVNGGRCIAWIRFGDTVIRDPYTDDEIKQMRDSMPRADQWVPDKTGLYYRSPLKNPDYPDACIEKKGNGYWIRNVEGLLFVDHPTLEAAVKEFNRYTVPKERKTKVLVIDEIQSIRHQEGRKTGYRDEKAYHEIELRFDKVSEEWNTFKQELNRKYGPDWQNMSLNQQDYGDKLKKDGLTKEEIEKCMACRKEFFSTAEELNCMEGLPPPAPFQKNWHELCLKRMLHYAAEKGYDQVAWTTGQQQIQRYKMDREIRSINVSSWLDKKQAGNYLFGETIHEGKGVTLDLNHNMQVRLLVDKNGTVLDFYDSMDLKPWRGMKLSKLLGQELAERVMKTDNGHLKDFEKVHFGGEGLMNLYDKMVPGFMNRFGKRYGVSTEPVELHLDYFKQVFHGLRMTDGMKEAWKKCQPMFMRDSKGKIYGWALDNTVYLTPKGINAETAIHEYTHLWANAMRLADNKAWQKIKGLLRATPMWNEVKKDMNYQRLRNNDDALANEVLARISGRANAEKLEQAVRQTTEKDTSLSIVQQLKTALNQFWSWVGRHVLHIRQARTITDVTDRILGDLLRADTLGRQQQERPQPDISINKNTFKR